MRVVSLLSGFAMLGVVAIMLLGSVGAGAQQPTATPTMPPPPPPPPPLQSTPTGPVATRTPRAGQPASPTPRPAPTLPAAAGRELGTLPSQVLHDIAPVTLPPRSSLDLGDLNVRNGQSPTRAPAGGPVRQPRPRPMVIENLSTTPAQVTFEGGFRITVPPAFAIQAENQTLAHTILCVLVDEQPNVVTCEVDSSGPNTIRITTVPIGLP